MNNNKLLHDVMEWKMKTESAPYMQVSKVLVQNAGMHYYSRQLDIRSLTNLHIIFRIISQAIILRQTAMINGTQW